MKQEYLFTDNSKKTEFEKRNYESVNVSVYGVENSDCWIATISIQAENRKSADILSKIHEEVINEFGATVLSNGCSAYYNKSLYPYFNEFERKLRKLLYLKSALSTEKDYETIKDLENKDFGEIFTLLFLDTQFVQSTKKTIGGKTCLFTKTEILAALEEIPENTLWDDLLGEKAVARLRSDFMKVKSYRNDVMHAHNMSTSSYVAALELIKEVNNQLDVEIGKIILEKEKCTTSEECETFNAAMSGAIKAMDAAESQRTLQEQFAEIQETLLHSKEVFAALDQYNRLLSHNDCWTNIRLAESTANKELQQQIHWLSEIKLDLPVAQMELQRIIKQNDLASPPGITALQEKLGALDIDPILKELKVQETIKQGE